MKTLRDVAVKICAIEGKKKQVNIAQVMEILKIVSLMIKADFTVLRILLK